MYMLYFVLPCYELCSASQSHTVSDFWRNRKNGRLDAMRMQRRKGSSMSHGNWWKDPARSAVPPRVKKKPSILRRLFSFRSKKQARRKTMLAVSALRIDIPTRQTKLVLSRITSLPRVRGCSSVLPGADQGGLRTRGAEKP